MLDFAMLDTQSPFFGQAKPDAVTLTETMLRTAIVGGGIAPGARLSEVELCTTYGQGRGIVRMALGRLAHGGFVVSRPRSGWTVSAISAAGLREVIMARTRLEGLLAEVPLSNGDVTHIRTICDMQAALRAAPSGVFAEHCSLQRSYDRQIREMLAAKMKAPMIGAWLSNLWDRSDRFLIYFEKLGMKSAPWFDWAPFIEAKMLGKDDEAAAILSKDCAAFARFSQASLLESDLVAPETAFKAPKAARIKAAPLQQPSRRRERPSKRTI
jgi:DNA-binding GntR family transcriptional regulator